MCQLSKKKNQRLERAQCAFLDHFKKKPLFLVTSSKKKLVFKKKILLPFLPIPCLPKKLCIAT